MAKEPLVMCKECAMTRPKSEVETTPCPWCGYDPRMSSKQRRFLRRLKERQRRK